MLTSQGSKSHISQRNGPSCMVNEGFQSGNFPQSLGIFAYGTVAHKSIEVVKVKMGRLELPIDTKIHMFFNSVGHFYSPQSPTQKAFLLYFTLSACDNQAASCHYDSGSAGLPLETEGYVI